MKKILFTKMQGAGNDFVVIDHVPGLDYCEFTKKVCNRHMGIGADGVLVLGESTGCDYKMSIINADGSEAEMCGNGARCMAVYIKYKFAVVPEVFTMETLAGKIHASVSGEVASVQLSDPKDYRANVEIKIGEQKLSGHFINTGVPHTVIFVEGLQEFDVDGLGSLIRHHKAFAPKGTNVNFVERVKDGVVAVRTFERGVEAETLACGTGSVASALIGYLQAQKQILPGKNATIRVATKSGELLDVSFDLDVKNDKPVITNVWLKGSGKIICKGEYYGI
ncbi:MAG: diaminopimelate epimerase [Candidatus Omnitrophica bacterium]|nr:diaminopimelate epimerase [Candidatus Omnitrophota bacterium]